MNSPPAGSVVLKRRSFTLKMCYDSRLPHELTEELWSDADRLVDDGTPLKQGDTTTVVRVDAAEASPPGKSWVLKRFNLRGLAHTTTHLLSLSRAARNWACGLHLCSGGIASPRPMAFLEQRLGPFRTQSYVLTEFVPGTRLREFDFKANRSDRELDVLCQEFARIWHRLGQLRMSHGDMKATNFLVASDHRLWLIDLDGARIHRANAAFRKARNRDWSRFMKNWRSTPEIANAFRVAVQRRSAGDGSNQIRIGPDR